MMAFTRRKPDLELMMEFLSLEYKHGMKRCPGSKDFSDVLNEKSGLEID